MKLKSLLFCASLLLAISLVALHHARAQGGVQKIEIVAKRFDYTPGDITAKKGIPVTILLTSKDADHGLKLKEFNVNLSVKKGETKEATFTPDKAGTFIGQCSVFCGSGHGSMKLTLHVTE